MHKHAYNHFHTKSPKGYSNLALPLIIWKAYLTALETLETFCVSMIVIKLLLLQIPFCYNMFSTVQKHSLYLLQCSNILLVINIQKQDTLFSGCMNPSKENVRVAQCFHTFLCNPAWHNSETAWQINCKVFRQSLASKHNIIETVVDLKEFCLTTKTYPGSVLSYIITHVAFRWMI